MVGVNKYTNSSDAHRVNSSALVIFKEFYQPRIREQLNYRRILLRTMTRNDQDVSGQKIVTALHTGNNWGIGAAGEYGKIPAAQRQQYKRAEYRMRYLYGAIQFSGPSVASSRNDRGAFINVMDSEIRTVTSTLQKEHNRMAHGNGSGALAKVTATALTSGAGSPTVFTLADPGGFANTGPGTQFMAEGRRVCIIGGAAGAPSIRSDGSVFTGFVQNVDHAAGTIEIEAGSTYTEGGSGTDWTTSGTVGTTNDYVYISNSNTLPAGEFSSTSLENEPNGLSSMFREGNVTELSMKMDASGGNQHFGAIDADATPVWNTPTLSNGGATRPITEDLLQRGEDYVQQVSGHSIGMWIGPYGIRRSFINSLIAAKRFPNTTKLKGGWTTVTHNGRPIVVDEDAIRGRLYGLSPECLYMYSETDWQWRDADGSVLERVSDEDAYRAQIYRYLQHGTDARNRHVLIDDIIN